MQTKFFAMALLILCGSAISAEPPYEVVVTPERVTDGVIYHYAITNRSGFPSRFITLGTKPYPGHTNDELTLFRSKPVGLSKGLCGEVGCAMIVSASSYSLPQSWDMNFTTIEDQTSQFRIELATERNSGDVLTVGKTLHFSIKLPRPDNSYVTSGFKVQRERGDTYASRNYYGQMKGVDNVAPTFDLTLNPVSADAGDGWATINASWIAKDESDSVTNVFLENIECGRPSPRANLPGETCTYDLEGFEQWDTEVKQFQISNKLLNAGVDRIYYVTYGAYDASGNRTEQRQKITIKASKTSIPGDLNGDMCVDDVDLQLLRAALEERRNDSQFDINRDGSVNTQDYLALGAGQTLDCQAPPDQTR